MNDYTPQAHLGWIDFSAAHRDRVMHIVDAFSQAGTLDQLGVGVVRDAIANWLFPGISTIQTRAKYFILIPQLFRAYWQAYLQNQNWGNLKKYLRAEENEIIHSFYDNCPKTELGIIGKTTAHNRRELKTMPSAIYWTGLRTHGFINTHLSLNDYLQLNNLEKGKAQTYQSDEQQDDLTVEDHFFNLNLPILPAIDYESLNMKLSKAEADFIQERFCSHPLLNGQALKQENNLLRFILEDQRILMLLLSEESNSFRAFAEALLATNWLPEDTQKVLALAVDFDFLMHGAHIRYNINVHTLHGTEGTQSYEDRWDVWLIEARENKHLLQAIDMDWVFATIAPNTAMRNRRFIIKWQYLVTQDAMDIKELDALVYQQELNNKPNPKQAKQHNTEYNDWVGIKEMSYRFKQVKDIVSDIYNAQR